MGGSPRAPLPNSFAHLSTRQVSRLAGLTDPYPVLGKTSAPARCSAPGSKSTADSSARPSAPARCSAPDSMGTTGSSARPLPASAPAQCSAPRLKEHNRVLGKTFAGFGPGSMFSARLKEHNRVLGKTFAARPRLDVQRPTQRAQPGPRQDLAGFGPGSMFSARLKEHNRVLGKTFAGFGPGSVFSARLEEHSQLLGMIGDLAQAVAFEDVAVAESLDAWADSAGVDPTKVRPELLSAALAALWLTWLIAAWLDYANTCGVDLEWANRFALIDDFGLVFGSTIAVYCNSLKVFKRLSL